MDLIKCSYSENKMKYKHYSNVKNHKNNTARAFMMNALHVEVRFYARGQLTVVGMVTFLSCHEV